MNENSECTDCLLHTKCKNVCLKGKGDMDSAKMAVFLDYPNMLDDKRGRPFVSESAELLEHLLARMGVKEYYLEYTVKCHPGKSLPTKKADRAGVLEACYKYRLATLQNIPNLKSVVALGKLSVEAFTGHATIKEVEGTECMASEVAVRNLGMEHVWCGYSTSYLLEKPAETPSIYRILWRAAEEAGLNPKETKVKTYDWKV